MENSSKTKKKVKDHISELRSRILISIIFFLIFSLIGYFLHIPLITFILKPFNSPVYFTSPVGGLSLYINTSLLFGFLLSLPIIIFHIFSFIAPIFPKKSKAILVSIVIFSTILMLLGVMFAYFISLPAALNFLKGFESENVKSLVTSNEYFDFISRYLLGFGLIFQLPLVVLILNYFKPLKIKSLIKYLPNIILGSFIIAAILTPTPDPFNQVVMALPIIFLYLFSIFLIFLHKRG